MPHVNKVKLNDFKETLYFKKDHSHNNATSLTQSSAKHSITRYHIPLMQRIQRSIYFCVLISMQNNRACVVIESVVSSQWSLLCPVRELASQLHASPSRFTPRGKNYRFKVTPRGTIIVFLFRNWTACLRTGRLVLELDNVLNRDKTCVDCSIEVLRE